MKTILVIDGHALAYRQYYALERTAMTTSENQPTWAVFGFFKTVVDMLKNKKIKIDAIVVAFDVSKRSFRTEKFSDYKATRTEMPDNMKSQMSLIQEGLRAFNIPIFTKEGYEADDVIGTVCKTAKDVGHRVYILTGDQDSFQLVDKGDNVTVLVAGKGQLIEYDWFKIHDKLGVYPNQVVDYKALAGDSSDNIPGVRGIGEKTAIKLLSQYKSLDNILENFEQITPPSIREKIRNGFESAKMCKDLATIRTDVDIDFDAEKACVQLPHVGEVTKFLQTMQFHTFIKNIDNILRLFSPTCEGEAELQVQLGLFAQSVEMNHQNHPFDTE
ncbi:hypothetical protein IJV79_04915, partial [bacterium]|nr:hypothetical protein [bacterium]